MAYEIRRLLFNKLFLGLLLITAIYAYLILRGDIIQGVANTAPFSAWSYGGFLSSILPMLLLSLLFFISSIYSKSEKCIAPIKMATPVDLFRYGLIRSIAIVIVCLVACLTVVVISMIFYATVFHFYSFGNFLLPLMLTIFPALFFVMGVGLLAGRFHKALIYVLMLLFLFLGSVPMPYGMDLLGSNFFSNYPMTLPIGLDGEPAFIVPVAVWVGKAVYSLLGVIFIGLGLVKFKKFID